MDRYFDLTARQTTVGREARGALATFLTMAYILVANPAILVAAGMPRESAIACTALAAGVCCLLMGFVGNFPIALAAGMGLNAVVAYQVTPLAGTWQRAMGLVVLDGLVVLLLVLMGLREAVMRAIPRDLRLAIGAGIGEVLAHQRGEVVGPMHAIGAEPGLHLAVADIGIVAADRLGQEIGGGDQFLARRPTEIGHPCRSPGQQ